MQGDLGHPDIRKSASTHNRCATTSTSGGMINLDRDEEWLIYENTTEAFFRNPNIGKRLEVRAPRPLAKSADGIRQRKPPVLSKNKSIILVDGYQTKRFKEIIFDERADGDKPEDFAALWMRKSLFPHVPPYVLFRSHDSLGKKLPKDFTHLLKWKATTCMPKILMRILINSGYQMITRGNEWSATWYAGSGDSSRYQKLMNFQKVNTIPGSQSLGNKDHLWTNLNKMMRKYGHHEYDFMPKTYVLPKDTRKLEGLWMKYCNANTWIIKPPNSGRGQGIKVIDQWWEIPKWHSVVVQRYISRPRLINNTKFDLRVYVLVTSVNPLRLYIYKEGLVRFASVRYIRGTNLNDKYMHLTNTSVNKQNPNYVMNDGVNSFKSHKWSFQSLWLYLRQEKVNVESLWSKIKDIVLKTIIAAESNISTCIAQNLTSNYTCYELYGFDVLIDENHKPWLLEVNALPSLQTDSPLDVIIKGALVKTVLNMAGYQVPKGELSDTRRRKYNTISHDTRLYAKNLSIREKMKHENINSLKNHEQYQDYILEKLTRDDLRQLIRYEDELTQIGNFEKLFPSKSSYYLKFFEVEKYYDRLLHAWEQRYSDDRSEGIALLRSHCGKMLHIQLNAG